MSKQSETGAQLFLLENHADFQEYALKLTAQTRRNIVILSRDLDASVFGTEEFVELISELARSSRYAEIKILVKNTRHLVETGHRLAKLSQRLSSKISLRKLAVEPDNADMGFMLCDTNALLYKNEEDNYQGFANFDAAVEVKRLRDTFDYVWEYGEIEPDLQVLSI